MTKIKNYRDVIDLITSYDEQDLAEIKRIYDLTGNTMPDKFYTKQGIDEQIETFIADAKMGIIFFINKFNKYAIDNLVVSVSDKT